MNSEIDSLYKSIQFEFKEIRKILFVICDKLGITNEDLAEGGIN